MRVAAVEVVPVAIPFATPLESAAGRWSGIRSAVVRLRTDAGIEGLGEMVGAADPAAREARAAVASATVDATARAAGRSVAEVLGPAPRADVAVNALIGRVPPDQAASDAVVLVEAGFGCLKVKGGGEPEDAIVARLASIRAAVGRDVALRLDLNGSLDEAAALRLLRRLASLDLEFVEQPVGAEVGATGLARLRAGVEVPIAADESVTGLAAARRLLDAAAVDVLVVKPARVGGVAEARRIVELADAAGIAVVVSTLFETGVGIVTALHLAATVPQDRAHGLATAGLLASDLLARPLVIVRGRMAVPAGPGLGIDLDPAALERYRAAAPVAVGRPGPGPGPRKGGR
jgi:L-alanine-DL-glutamate epimerase-like enolase superfamily enzyme